MIFIGERINAGFKDVKQAVIDRNASVIEQWAIRQTEAKASYLDVCMGTASGKIEDYLWMIETVQRAVDTPLSIDANKTAMIAAALKICKKPPIINSTTVEDARLDELMGLAAAHGASIICLSMDETGSPKSADKRVENAAKAFAKAMELGLAPEQVFLDPIVMPLKFMQEQIPEILKAASQFTLFSDPPCHIVAGLSNVSNGAKRKPLINRTMAAMLVAHGLSAVICDVCDKELVDTILTAELLMNRSIYADSYLEAFRC